MLLQPGPSGHGCFQEEVLNMDAAHIQSLEKIAEEARLRTDGYRKKREESLWLSERYERFRQKENLSRAECDALLYEKSFGEAAALPANAQRIRFWRTGRYYPQSRSICLSFARALELDESETLYCLTAWYDHCDRSFPENDPNDSVYVQRTALMEELILEFLSKIPPEETDLLCAAGTAPRQNLRHIYCSKAIELTSLPKQAGTLPFPLSTHISTASYTAQFTDEMRLLGEISRSTMLRHLLLLGMPFVSTDILNERLTFLGYCPLRENHSDRYGNAMDDLLLQLMELYGKVCSGYSPEECSTWLRETFLWLDQYFSGFGYLNLCLFRFRHLTNRTNTGGKGKHEKAK